MILIVEDEVRIANWLKVFFEDDGFVAEVAHDGEVGLHLAHTHQPELIVLDLMLPKLDGMEVCRILRDEPAAGGWGWRLPALSLRRTGVGFLSRAKGWAMGQLCDSN